MTVYLLHVEYPKLNKTVNTAHRAYEKNKSRMNYSLNTFHMLSLLHISLTFPLTIHPKHVFGEILQQLSYRLLS